MKALFIDDERIPKDVFWINYPENLQWDIVRNYNQATEYITINGLPEFISFDNDLGEPKEGYDILKWLIEYCLDHNLKLPICAVHTKNCEAADNMINLINNFNKQS